MSNQAFKYCKEPYLDVIWGLCYLYNMLFNSLQYLYFLPIVTLIYFLIPVKYRYLWLLVCSYYFYMCWNAKYALLMFTSTILTWISGLIIETAKKNETDGARQLKKKRIALAFCFIINLSILFFFKYYSFMTENIMRLFGLVGIQFTIPRFDVLLPVGISFYTFQALGYVMDVYRDTIYAEKNFLRYSLFVSFFPQLVAGPIERSKNLLKQLNVPTRFSYTNVRKGLLTMVYGFILKLVIADNISAIIEPVFDKPGEWHGLTVAFAVVLFALQIYCDFNGYTQIAIGSARILGFRLQENFRTPYLALNMREFWRNWHISLTSWFTDYVYIPLGGSRRGRRRHYMNILIVFFLSGLWHGASWHFVFWGGLNGLYLVCGDFTNKSRQSILKRMKIDPGSRVWTFVRWLVTFFLTCYSWLYFRVQSMGQAFQIQRQIISDVLHRPFSPSLLTGLIYNYSDRYFLIGFLLALTFMILTDVWQKKQIHWRDQLQRQRVVFRWVGYVSMLIFILLYGAYGKDHGQTQFIYFQF